MFYVYILRSEKDKKLYVGCTTNIEKRIKGHNAGEVESTRPRRPLILIHQEKMDNKTEAFKRERFLKSLWGSREKRKIVRDFLNSRAKP